MDYDHKLAAALTGVVGLVSLAVGVGNGVDGRMDRLERRVTVLENQQFVLPTNVCVTLDAVNIELVVTNGLD